MIPVVPGLKTSARQLGLRLADLVVPRACCACGMAVGWDGGAWCAACADELSALVEHDYCHQCGERLGPYLLSGGVCTDCREKRSKTRFAAFARVGRYHGALRHMLLRFKRNYSLDRLLGRLLADAVRGVFDPSQVDVWVPVPSHWQRRLEVGFWPTRLLADAMASHWGGAVVPVLRATRYVKPFHERRLPASARKEEIKGAFSLRRGMNVDGLSVGLVDDVMSTGATLGEARRILRRAGAKQVFAAVVARPGWVNDPFAGVDQGPQSAYDPSPNA